MTLSQGTPWAGTEAGLNAALQAWSKIEAMSDKLVDSDENTEKDKPLYRVENGTAIINVKGPMLNADLPGGVAEFFGVVTYPGLQRQFAAAAEDARVERVVLDVNSPGGQVSGLHETAEALAALKDKKPVAAYASDCIASAAYWLGSAGSPLMMSPAGNAGSIGVIAVHISSKAAVEGQGLKPTVVRAGAKKHLGHPLEDFSEEARAELQKEIDFHHRNFMQAVADNRGMTFSAVEAGIGDGRCFYGAEAKDVGLVDSIGSFSSFVEGWQPQAVQPFSQPGGFVAANSGEPTMNLEEAMAQVEALQGELSTRETALASAEARAVQAEKVKAEADATNTALAASLTAAQAANEDFAAVLEANITAKASALGTKVLMPDTLEGKQAMNAQLEGEFQKAFPAGGVAATATDTESGEAEASAPDWFKTVVR